MTMPAAPLTPSYRFRKELFLNIARYSTDNIYKCVLLCLQLKKKCNLGEMAHFTLHRSQQDIV
jgi:hypothetical protein